MPDLTVTIKSEQYRNASGWGIWHTDKGVVKGVVGWAPKEGEALILSGRWETSSYTGRQEFTFRTARAHIETDPRAMLHYACSITDGLGPAKEQAIWLLYGEAWQSATELAGIGGLSHTVVPEWQLTLARVGMESARFEAIAWLLSHGCTDNLAAIAWKEWEENTLGIVTADPYRLADLPRYGFLFVDEHVAPTLGIGKDDPRRHCAALRYALKEHINQTGDSCPTVLAMRTATSGMMSAEQFDAAFESSTKEGAIAPTGANHITTPALYKAESTIWAYAQAS